MSDPITDLPVIVIGAGPIGLATAAHLVERGITPLVLERGAAAGAAMREWGHISLFSPWQFNTDPAARRILSRHGWVEPPALDYPTGADIVNDYLAPLAATPELAPHIRYNTLVTGVSRDGIDKTRTLGRSRHPLVVRVATDNGVVDYRARAVIDASGTWHQRNPVGASGLPAAGEAEAGPWLTGPLPDVLGRDRERFAGKSTLVLGLGHSAANTLLALVALAEQAPGTTIHWGIRGRSARRLFGGGSADQLPARGELGQRLKEAVDRGVVVFHKDFTVTQLTPTGQGQLAVQAGGAGAENTVTVDALVAATGFRPDLGILREVRVTLDPVIEAPVRLAPDIDPNEHSCGTVRPHGVDVLTHDEEGLYIIGMKSYGRAPTFLLATGCEQARSVVAHIAGDAAAASRIELQLPTTGVCNTTVGA